MGCGQRIAQDAALEQWDETITLSRPTLDYPGAMAMIADLNAPQKLRRLRRRPPGQAQGFAAGSGRLAGVYPGLTPSII